MPPPGPGGRGARILIGLAPLQELDRARPDNVSGTTVVAVALLVALWLRVRRTAPTGTAESGNPSGWPRLGVISAR